MASLLDKIEFTQEEILDIISSKTEESINIDFKDARALSSENGKEISKDVSAFANSDGGMIFYGINEENHVASGLSFIDGDKYNKEWLENKITTNIQQRIENLLIIPVRFDNDITKTIYIVKIPKSGSSPHINADKKYYRRFNFKSVPMEEYEVRDSYLRVSESRVEFDRCTVRMKRLIDEIYISIEIHAINKGNNIAEKYRVVCTIYGNKNFICTTENKHIQTNTESYFSIATNDVIPIFPNESINILSFNLRFHNSLLVDFCKKNIIDLTIYNQGTIETIEENSILKDIEKLVEKNPRWFK
ncbi:helix-turn-helix domain-containing protein [Flavobacterium pectinovorum]|uniref:ATP-binding protein n=1 Tax=Flavobacterium pectinovorum TaxID=29533 RepID=A0A502F5B7_9FLAO|nr:ATP-binding protein [Flavobacterium pectinovorum]TPG44149.1 ATP-binding protein [Flavobacterium pectinovorum]